MHRPAIAFAVTLALLAPTQAAPSQKSQTFSADYSVTLLGLPVASARFDSTFSGRNFRIEGSLASSGIARLFDKTDGTTSVKGSIDPDGVSPRSFVANYTSGRKKGRTTIRFSGDEVTKFVNVPKPKKRGADWIPVGRQHLKAALDPLSSTLIPATDPSRVCDRTIRVFDGEMRADLKLTHEETGPIRGFEGEAVTCSAQFIPVAGYRKGRKQIEYLKNDSRISVSFMPLGETGFYAPVDASIGTQIGTLRITARNVEVR